MIPDIMTIDYALARDIEIGSNEVQKTVRKRVAKRVSKGCRKHRTIPSGTSTTAERSVNSCFHHEEQGSG